MELFDKYGYYNRYRNSYWYDTDTRTASTKRNILSYRSNFAKLNELPTKNNEKSYVYAEYKLPFEYYGCHTINYSAEGDVFAAGFGNGTVQIHNTLNCEVQAVLVKPTATSRSISTIKFHPNDSNVLFCGNLDGQLYCMKRNNLTSTVFAQDKDNEVNSLDINATGDFAVSGGKDAAIRVYDINKKKLALKLAGGDAEKRFHKLRINVVKCHPDEPKVFFTAGFDNCVKMWDTRSTRSGPVMTIFGPHIYGNGLDIKDVQILTASWIVANSLQVFDRRSGKLLEVIQPINRQNSLEGEFYYTCKFHKGSFYGDVVLAAGSGSGSVDVIQRNNKKMRLRFKTNKTIFAIDTIEEGCIFGGQGNLIKAANIIIN